MSFRRVARFISITAAAITIAMLFPAAWSAATGDGGARPLVYSFAAGAAVAGALFFAGRGAEFQDMSARDAILSVAGAWVVASALIGLPYFFSGAAANPLDAFFEGVSGFTTTGATVLRSLEMTPRGILLWRCFSQWFGGVGIVVLTLAFLPFAGAGMQLYKAEVTGPFHERLTPRIQQTAAILCKTYLALTTAELLFLLAGGLGFFDAVTLSFSTVATGGFSPYADNAGHFSGNYVKFITAVFLFLSGMNLTLFHAVIVKRSAAPLHENPEFRFYVGVMLLFGSALSLILYSAGSYGAPLESLAGGFFHTVSMLATCGFFTADYSAWPASARMLMLVLMFCGGCAISTAGGITCVRALVILRHIGAEFTRRTHPKAVVTTRIGGEPLEPGVVTACFSYFTAYIGIFIISVALLGLFGQDLATSVSGVAATLGNVGPGFEMAGPSAGYAAMPAEVKAVYIFLMLCGRLGIFTLLILFTPKFWRA